MKPTRDGEGVASDQTSEKLLDPNMTQDEPERDKVEKSVNFLRACAAWFRSEAADAMEDKAHWARVYNAENCDKAADLLSTALVISQNYQSLMVTAEREAASARSSLARVVEAIQDAVSSRFTVGAVAACLEIEEILRSALHRSQGE